MVGPFLDTVAQICALIVRVFELLLDDCKFFHLGPAEHTLVLPDEHVIAKIMSTTPPRLIRNILRSAIDLKHLSKILLRVKPSLFDDEVVYMGLNLFVLKVVSVHEV